MDTATEPTTRKDPAVRILLAVVVLLGVLVGLVYWRSGAVGYDSDLIPGRVSTRGGVVAEGVPDTQLSTEPGQAIELDRPPVIPVMPATSESRAVLDPSQEPVDFARKYEGVDAKELRRAEQRLGDAARAMQNKIGADLLAAGKFETREVGLDGVGSDGPWATTMRFRGKGASRVVDVAKWLPSDYPELQALHDEMTWLEWKIHEFEAPGEIEPPHSQGPR